MLAATERHFTLGAAFKAYADSPMKSARKLNSVVRINDYSRSMCAGSNSLVAALVVIVCNYFTRTGDSLSSRNIHRKLRGAPVNFHRRRSRFSPGGRKRYLAQYGIQIPSIARRRYEQ